MNLSADILMPPVLLMLSLVLWTAWGQWRIRRDHPPAGRFLNVRGTRLHYVEAGSGPAIVLVHGASSNLNEFTGSLLPALARSHRVIAFDRPGYGYSERPRQREWLDPGQLAALFLEAAETLGCQQPLLVGHSWGASVVMAALVEQPDRVSGGVLLAGVAGHWAGGLGWTYRLGELPVLRSLFAWLLLYPVGRFLLAGGVREVLAPGQPRPQHLRDTAVALALRPRSFLLNVMDTNRLSEYLQALSARYEEISRPLLIIHGEEDALVPYWNHGKRVLPVVRGSRAVLLAQAGHAPHHTHGDAVCREILAFQALLPAGGEAGDAAQQNGNTR